MVRTRAVGAHSLHIEPLEARQVMSVGTVDVASAYESWRDGNVTGFGSDFTSDGSESWRSGEVSAQFGSDEYAAWRDTRFEVQTFDAADLITSLDEPEVVEGPGTLDAQSSSLIGLDQVRTSFGAYRGQGYSVAVIDTGIDYRHTSLGGGWGNRVIAGYDFVNNDSDPLDDNGHGTHVAGIIGSSHATHLGLAPEVNLIALKVLGADGSGSFGAVEDALQWVIDHRQQYNIVAVNMSLGAGNFSSNPYTFLEDEFASLKNSGVFLAAAAGNSFYAYGSTQGLGYPAISSLTVSVGAVWDANVGSVTFGDGARDNTTAPDRVTSFTQRSSGLDIFAPGAFLTNTYLNNTYRTLAGTSMAAPVVAGAAALLHQALVATGQAALANQDQILALMKQTGVTIVDGDDENDNVTNTGLSFKRLDLLAAVQQVVDQAQPAPQPEPEPDPEPSPSPFPEHANFFAYHPNFDGGVRVATGDVNGDGRDDIITSAGAGGGPHIRVFDGATGNQVGGTLGSFYAYHPNFTGGVYVAAGDIDGDGRDDIITAAGASGGPHVKVFSGLNGSLIREFYAYHPNFTGGVFVAAGDVNGDGRDDIITGAGAGGGPHVRVFSGTDNHVITEFFAYQNFTGGVRVAAGDVDGDGRDEIITAPGAGGGAHIRVFTVGGGVVREAFAYAPTYLGGVYISAADLNGDGADEIIVGTGSASGPNVRVLCGLGCSVTDSFDAYHPNFRGGVFVAAGDTDGDGHADIVTGAGATGGPHVRIWGGTGALGSALSAGWEFVAPDSDELLSSIDHERLGAAARSMGMLDTSSDVPTAEVESRVTASLERLSVGLDELVDRAQSFERALVAELALLGGDGGTSSDLLGVVGMGTGSKSDSIAALSRSLDALLERLDEGLAGWDLSL